MPTYAGRSQENKSQSEVNAVAQKQGGGEASLQFVDNRPEAVAQRKLQEMANNSPQVSQLRALQQMANSSTHAKRTALLPVVGGNGSVESQLPIQTKSNNTGLPDNLKSGVENLSGYVMDDVKVHYNSSKPAQLQAFAYAQGSDIHVAPGQEQHLPHEAWHVVQQKQGRVQPTMQMKEGAAVNDDKGLESEADVMGGKAVQMKMGENINQTIASYVVQEKQGTDVDFKSTIQRTPEWGQHRDTDFDEFVTKLDLLVNGMFATVIKAPLAIPDADGYITRFKILCKAIVAEFNAEFNRLQGIKDDVTANQGAALEKAVMDTPFLHAAFGYAVESLTNLNLGSGVLNSALPQNHKIILQATRGATRPDIVVQNADKQDAGWFDITASNSTDHILGKSGSGWTTRPYVAEVTYPSLEKDHIISIVSSAAGAKVDVKELQQALEVREKDKAARINKLYGLVKLSIDSSNHISDSAKRAKNFEETLGSLIGLKDTDGNELKVTPSVAKSFIELVLGMGAFSGMSYAKVALMAGYKGSKQQGRNREKAMDLLYTML